MSHLVYIKKLLYSLNVASFEISLNESEQVTKQKR